MEDESVKRNTALLALLGVTALVLVWQMADNPDPQAYKCKHGNAPGVCLLCWAEKQNPPK